MILGYKEFTRLVEEFSTELPELLASHHKTRDLAPQVHGLLKFVETRFTLAVVGQMRAGKSSLINALIGADLAMVGVNETTATINWFTYGAGEKTRRFRVHWRGRPPEDRDILERGHWSGESKLAEDTRKLEFFAATDFLRIADVIDTPGTRSLITAHQATVDAFLDRKAGEADAETRTLGGGADAILYVLPSVGRSSDAELLEEIQRNTRLPNSPPHNSLAVVHKWETLDCDDPHAEACSKAELIYRAMGEFVSAAMPVSAPLGWAAERFPDSFWDFALEIARNMAPSDLEELLLDSRDFIENDSVCCPLDCGARKHFREEFKIPWPCLRVLLRFAQNKAPGNPVDLRKGILEISGLQHLRHKIQNQFFARASVLKMSKLLATAWGPCDRAQHLLRNYKLELNNDLQRADLAKAALEQRIAEGDVSLMPAQEFIQSAAGKLEQDMLHVGDNLRRVGEMVLKVKDTQEQMERDLSMIDILDQRAEGLTPSTLEMLRCLFGRADADVATRLSFLATLGKATASIVDLDDTIRELRRGRPHIPGKARAAIDHGIDRLEQIANWMDEKNLPQIPLQRASQLNR
ncbi:MAG: hypothetical protein JWM16_4355 [Verrucomicrobiales bacterium]|nr:hypothetical protein [Verrucomicrobiales bacterium]